MHKYKHIQVLDGNGEVGQHEFGRKAAMLALALNAGFDVPAGFCVSAKLCARIANSKAHERYIRILADFVRHTISLSESHKLIIRSSSRFEDHPNRQFAGLFDSYRNIETTEDVIHCIEKIICNSRRVGLAPYYRRVMCDPSELHMAVIVQCQMNFEYSGIASIIDGQIHIEAVSGHLSRMISGEKGGITFQRFGDKYHCVSDGSESRDPQVVNDISSKLVLLDFDLIHKHFGDAVVEFGLVAERSIVLQVRKPFEADISTSHFSGEFESRVKRLFGTKAAAMQFFAQNGLFNKPLRIIKAGAPVKDVISHVESLFDNCDYVTIRFSRGNDIGLPRAFTSSRDQARLFLQSKYQRDFTTIAHEYIEVVRSFEILVGENFAILEHIPGMWESSVALHPDVIMLDHTSAEAFIYKLDRVVSLEHKSKQKNIGDPISEQTLNKFVQLLQDVTEVVRKSFSIDLPVNVHSVWDEELDSYHCINIRKGFFPEPCSLVNQNYHEVRSISDLSIWDGKSTIRLKLQTERGGEHRLVALAEALSGVDAPLVVDFGLLSHPAMVLRDFGCRLVPSYRYPHLFESGTYVNRRIAIDVGGDAFDRILNEPHVVSTEHYIVVKDGEPINELHLLGMMRKRSLSVVDTDRVSEVRYLLERASAEFGAAFYFERGRASFCTSGFGWAQDHFHIVGGLDCKRTFSRLAERVKGETYPDLTTAYENAPDHGEYCVFGCERTGFMVSNRSAFGKRMFRENVVLSSDSSLEL